MESNRSRITRALVVLLSTTAVIVISFFVWRYVNQTVADLREKSFEAEIEIPLKIVRDKVFFIENVLYSLRGFVSAGQIDSEKWRNYIIETNIEDRYAGLFSFFYQDIVRRQDLSSYIQDVRTEEIAIEYDDFTVFPRINEPTTYPIRYLFTTDKDLALMLGFDAGSTRELKEALDMAVKTGRPVMSELLHLKRLIPSSDETRYVVFLPVYSSGAIGAPPENIVEYANNFVGVFIDPGKLFTDLEMTGQDGGSTEIVKFDIYDGDTALIKRIDDENGKNLERNITLLDRNFKMVFASPKQPLLPFFQEYLPIFTIAVLLIILVLWYVTVVSVIYSRRRAEEMANVATKDLRKFKMAVDGVSDHVIITDPAGVIVYANNAASRITGYSNKEIIGKRPNLWGGLMDEDYYKKMWNTIKTEKRSYYGEIKNKRKSGELYEAEIHISPILNEKDEIVYYVGIERDVTRIKAIDRMKTEFISLASHQLRTPLSAVKWFGKMLLAGDAGKLNSLQKNYLNKINASNEREIQLVNALLNISRIESGKISVVPRPTEMKSFVQGIINEIQTSEEKKQRIITLKIEKNIPLIKIDPELIRHVYMNLLSNAVKYTNTKGKIEVNVFKKGKYLVSTVKDSGIGIPKDEQYRIFDRFFRASNAVKKETDGSGLGLYLAKTIVESSNGKIWFESEPNNGTTFFFSLPLSGIKTKKGDKKLI